MAHLRLFPGRGGPVNLHTHTSGCAGLAEAPAQTQLPQESGKAEPLPGEEEPLGRKAATLQPRNCSHWSFERNISTVSSNQES